MTSIKCIFFQCAALCDASVPGLHPTFGPEGLHLIVQKALEMLLLLQQLPLLSLKHLDLLVDDVTKTFSAAEETLGLELLNAS